MKFLNSTLRVALTAIGLSLACVSAYLTATYLYDVGYGTGFGFTFGTAGLLLDAAKTCFPIACFNALANNRKGVALGGLVLALAMMLTSYTISVAAITESMAENRTQTATNSIEQSSKYQNITMAIEPLQAQLDSLKKQQQAYIDISYKTQASNLQPKIDFLSQKISDLYLERGSMPAVTAQFVSLDSLSISILSGLIELVASSSLVLAASLGHCVKKQDTPKHAHAPQVEDVPPATATLIKDEEVDREFIDSALGCGTEPVEANEPDELCVAAKQALLDGVRPSERELQKALGITRKRAGELLLELEASGFIKRNDRGHRELTT